MLTLVKRFVYQRLLGRHRFPHFMVWCHCFVWYDVIVSNGMMSLFCVVWCHCSLWYDSIVLYAMMSLLYVRYDVIVLCGIFSKHFLFFQAAMFSPISRFIWTGPGSLWSRTSSLWTRPVNSWRWLFVVAATWERHRLSVSDTLHSYLEDMSFVKRCHK